MTWKAGDFSVRNTKVTINEKPLDKITSTKRLVMIIDDILNFNQHIDFLIKKTSSKIALLKGLRHILKG